MGWTQDRAAKALGVTPRTVRNYEQGKQDVPQAVALACWALMRGVREFDGPALEEIGAATPPDLQASS
jgi:transcriptional regulator with XRE-family HTH domain